MREEKNLSITLEVKEKMKKNLVYIGIFSVFMVFAGLTSGYIVSMGDSFWVKFPFPSAFWISTIVILLSSLFIQQGISFAKKGKHSISKIFVVLTFVFGLLFVYFQFKGYGQLSSNGSHLRGDLMVVEGRYGSAGDEGRYYGYYEIKYNGKFIGIDGNDYLLNGKKLSDSQFLKVQKFMSQFEKIEFKKDLIVNNNYGKEFSLYYKQQPLDLIDGKLSMPDSTKLEFVDLSRLQSLAINIRDCRGDFFIHGKLGKDFHVYYKGKELEYKNREWYYHGKILDDYLQAKPLESPDTASSYLWVITFLHLLHIIFTLFYMGKMTIFSISGKFEREGALSLKLGAIFWHFLGALWIFLFFFLLFIH